MGRKQRRSKKAAGYHQQDLQKDKCKKRNNPPDRPSQQNTAKQLCFSRLNRKPSEKKADRHPGIKENSHQLPRNGPLP